MAKEMVHGIMRDLGAEMAAYNAKWNAVYKAVETAKCHEVARVCARFEFESDQFQTAEQKAQAYINNGSIAPRY